MAVTKQQVAELYVATFNRAPDAAGLDYWVNTSGLTIENIAKSFFDQAETQTLYPEGTTDTAFVTSVYTNLFNRAPDAAGLAYWVADLAAGTSRSVMIEAMKNGAQGTDATIIANKATVALAYAASGLEGSDFSLASVTADSTTVSAALGNVSDLSNPGSSFALSSGIANGTAGIDAISATSATYAATTILDGKAGTDTLTVTATDDVTATPTIINVENVNFNLNAFTTPAGTGTIFNIATDNIAAANINVDVTQAASSVVSTTLTGLATGAVVTASDDFTTAIIATGKSDNEALTVTGKAAAITANSAGTLTAATITSTSATAATLTTDSDGTATLTTTVADMIIDATAATSVTATSAVGIDAATNNLTAATTVNLTALDDVDADLTAAVSATISAGTVATGAVSTITDTTGTTLKTLNLSGNASAVTFDLSTAAIDLNTVNVSGAQSVTVKVSGANIDGTDPLTVVDTTTAGTTTLDIAVANVGALNLANAAADVIKFSAAIANATAATFASGAAVTFSVDQGNAITVDGADATAAANTLAITLDDGAHANAAGVDLTNMTITDFGAVTIDASADDVKSVITTLTATADNTDVTINAGALGVTIATTANLGTGDLVINSTGAVTLTGATITAASVTTVGAGAVTMTTLDTSKVSAMTTGSGVDAITVTASNGNLALNTGAGNDTITWAAALATTTAKTYAIDGGDGTLDTLTIGDGADLTTGTSSVTLANIEKIVFANAAGATTATVDNAMLSGKTYIISDNNAAAVTVTVDLGTDTVSDLSTLVVDTANLVAGDGFIVSGAAATSAVTLTGSSLDDTLTGSAYADTLTGGAGVDTISGGLLGDTINGGAGADILAGDAGDDTITAGEGADHVTGGAGADTIVLTETTAAADNVVVAALTDGSAAGVAAGTFTGYDVITGYVLADDSIVFDSAYANDGAVTTAIIDGAKAAFASTAALVALNDLTTTNFADVDQVVNYFNDLIGTATYTASAAANDVVAVTFGTTSTALYLVNDADSDGAIIASELTLLGTVNGALTAADLIIV